MKPLFKYTGGKYREYKYIKDKMPEVINNYYEPFVGGGGVLFRLNEENKVKGKNFINDNSKILMDFYSCVGNEEFQRELGEVVSAWYAIKIYSEFMARFYDEKFFDFILGKIDEKNFVNDEMAEVVSIYCASIKYNTHGFSLKDKIIESLNDKAKRFSKKDISIEEKDVPYKAIRTAMHQALYFVIRDMYNEWNNGRGEYTMEEKCAQWFFIREFCFGSMFRFGPNSNFNVPYGGFDYNDKNFDEKVDLIFSDEAKFLKDNTEAFCMDFSDFLLKFNYGENDFIFLDPPYDSTFSDYDGNSFTREDHVRLANVLKSINCKWMMAIGKTDFIADLYKDFHVSEYNKTYSYQARGEYDNKHTTHLLITNY